MKDRDPLPEMLQTWRHDPVLAPGFSEKIWTRIHASAQPAAPAKIIRFPFPLSLAASFTVLLAGLAGTGAALAFSRSQSTERMAAAYVRTIDPLQMTATAEPHSHS